MALVALGERRSDAESLLERAKHANPNLKTANDLVRDMLRMRTVRVDFWREAAHCSAVRSSAAAARGVSARRRGRTRDSGCGIHSSFAGPKREHSSIFRLFSCRPLSLTQARTFRPKCPRLLRRVNSAQPTWSYTRQQRRRSHSVAPIDPSEPSINVTIGRVEVRAVPSDNKPTTPRRSESPVMPLEEYLRKQRRGGER